MDNIFALNCLMRNMRYKELENDLTFQGDLGAAVEQENDKCSRISS